MRGMPTYSGGGGGVKRVWVMWRAMVGRGMHQVTSERARARRHMCGGWGGGGCVGQRVGLLSFQFCLFVPDLIFYRVRAPSLAPLRFDGALGAAWTHLHPSKHLRAAVQSSSSTLCGRCIGSLGSVSLPV